MAGSLRSRIRATDASRWDLGVVGVLALGLAITWLGWVMLSQQESNDARYRIATDTNRTLGTVQSQMGLLFDDAFDVGLHVTVAGGSNADHFAEFVSRSEVLISNEIVQHVGFAERLGNSPAVIDMVTRNEQATQPDYGVLSVNDTRDDVALLNRISSRDGASHGLTGLDLYSDATIERLLDSLDVIGEVGVVSLWSSTGESVLGDGLSPADLLVVQAISVGGSSGVRGWILVSLRSAGLADLLADAVGDELDLQVTLFDPAGGEGSVRQVFDSRDASGTATTGEPLLERRFDAGGLTWGLAAWPTGPDTGASGLAAIAALAGVAASVALTLAVWSRRRTRMAIAELDRSERRVRHDGLTGLLNRVGLMERLDEALAAARTDSGDEVVLLFIDLDRFKVVNDSMGHEVGDRLLQRVAERIQLASRPEDAVARFGGDEFAVVCASIGSVEQATRAAQRILDAFVEPVSFDGGGYPVSVSVGIAMADPSSPDAAVDIVRDADAAMYRAKSSGRGRYAVFDDSLRHEVMTRLETEQALHAAFEADEFRVHYQPLVSADTEQVVALEALLRWQRPGVGLVPPGQFLAVAEDAGLMAMIGNHVLDAAVGRAAAWNADRGSREQISVSVNVADRHFVESTFVRRIERVLFDHQLDPSLLTLELSEDLVIEQLQPTLRTLQTLDQMGVKLAIDDFGTGRSSLWLLEQLHMVSMLKIDRSFVAPLPGSAANRAIIKAVVAMAPTLGMQVVAEGVETVAQRDVLRDLGVEVFQGYLYSQALTGSDADELLAQSIEQPVEERPRESV